MHSQAEILYPSPHNKSFRTTGSSLKDWVTLDVCTSFVVDPALVPVQHDSRRIPVVLREEAKTKLADLKMKRASGKRPVQHRIGKLLLVQRV